MNSNECKNLIDLAVNGDSSNYQKQEVPKELSLEEAYEIAQQNDMALVLGVDIPKRWYIKKKSQ